MPDMQIAFTFDNDKIEMSGNSTEDIIYIIKKIFAKYDLPCISGGPVISFSDNGGEDDYSDMWTIILSLFMSDWFTDIVTSCIWKDDFECEDVLEQMTPEKILYLKQLR